jgi:hypothetical protein
MYPVFPANRSVPLDLARLKAVRVLVFAASGATHESPGEAAANASMHTCTNRAHTRTR